MPERYGNMLRLVNLGTRTDAEDALSDAPAGYVICEICALAIDKTGFYGYYILVMEIKDIIGQFNITDIGEKADYSRGCAAAVGCFDGVHLGHRALIGELCVRAGEKNIPAVIFTFSPDDRPKQSAKLLASHSLNRRLLAACGINRLAEIPFGAVRNMPARDFVRDILLGIFNVRLAIGGYNFRFGYRGSGDNALLSEVLAEGGAECFVTPAYTYCGIPVSSSEIRERIHSGDIRTANAMLGRRYSFSGTVIHGKGMGHRLGFPTINIPFPEGLTVPRYGVYVSVTEINGRLYDSVTNIGIRPTFDRDSAPVSETFIFDFSEDVYDCSAEISLCGFIREERLFEDTRSLVNQIEADKICAKSFLSEGGSTV